jgi:hypothetical protein
MKWVIVVALALIGAVLVIDAPSRSLTQRIGIFMLIFAGAATVTALT